MKKIKSLILPLLTIFISTSLLSCNKKNNNDESANKVEMSFVDELIELDVFQSKRINIDTEYTGNIEYYTENKNIAKVVDGNIIGISGGETTLYAKVNSQSVASTNIIVFDDGEVPFIEIDNKLNLLTNSTFTLNPKVLFKGKEQDAIYSYTSEDENVVKIDKYGRVSAHQIGDTTITVTANYLEFSGNEFDFLKKTIDVHVSEEVIIQISASNYDISYEKLTIDSKEYLNEADLTGNIYVDGKNYAVSEKNISFVSSNPEIASISNDKLIGHKIGDVEVYAKYQTNNGTYTSNILQISVNKPLINVENSFDIDLSNEEIELDTSFFISKSENLEKIFDTDNKNENIYEQGKLVNYDEFGPRTWIFETDKYRYQKDVICCSKIIYDDAELRKLHVYSKNLLKGSKGVVSFEGYYILGNDINMNGKAFLKNVSYDFGATSVDSGGFIGTFDGRGHTISNAIVSANYGGLFGTLNKQSVVENVFFKDCKVTSNSGLISSYSGGTIRNCYITGETSGAGTDLFPKSLLVSQILPGSEISNCVIEYNNVLEKDNYAVAVGRLVGVKENVFDNVYVINTTTRVFSTTEEKVYDTFKTEANGQYLDYASFKNKANLDSFNDYWFFGENEILFHLA